MRSNKDPVTEINDIISGVLQSAGWVAGIGIAQSL